MKSAPRKKNAGVRRGRSKSITTCPVEDAISGAWKKAGHRGKNCMPKKGRGLTLTERPTANSKEKGELTLSVSQGLALMEESRHENSAYGGRGGEGT